MAGSSGLDGLESELPRQKENVFSETSRRFVKFNQHPLFPRILANHSTPSSDKAKNEWICTSTSFIRLHGV
jgi:hypothetical protein